jgi:cytochrome b subunit of formate dehydrogenase
MLDTKRSHTKGAISTTGVVVILAISAYHTLGTQLPSWARDLIAFLGMVCGIGLVGVIAWAMGKEIFSPTTAAKIRQWHVGQFLLFWLGVLFLAGLFGVTMTAIPYTTTRHQEVQCPIEQCGSVPNQFGQVIPYTKWKVVRDPHPTGDLIRGIGGIVLILGIPLTLLGISWVWFGGRPKRGA